MVRMARRGFRAAPGLIGDEAQMQHEDGERRTDEPGEPHTSIFSVVDSRTGGSDVETDRRCSLPVRYPFLPKRSNR